MQVRMEGIVTQILMENNENDKETEMRICSSDECPCSDPCK